MISHPNNLKRFNPCAPHSFKRTSASAENMRAVAYSMDILVPGVYFWFGNLVVRIGGCKPDDDPYPYPGTLHSFAGLAVVLPSYRIFTTYNGTYDP